MSYPDKGIAERWVKAGSKPDDPIVLNNVPYVVMLGDVRNDCTMPCPEQQVRTVGEDEEVLTTVYTLDNHTAYTVTVEAEIEIAIDQFLYIKDDTVGNVVLTNVNSGDLSLWGKVFDFALPDNRVTPNNFRWLQEGEVGVTGCVEAIMVECTCPELASLAFLKSCRVAHSPNNTVYVDSNFITGTCPHVFNNVYEAMNSLTTVLGMQYIIVTTDTVENNNILHKDNVTVILNPSVIVTLTNPYQWIIPTPVSGSIRAYIEGGFNSQIITTDDSTADSVLKVNSGTLAISGVTLNALSVDLPTEQNTVILESGTISYFVNVTMLTNLGHALVINNVNNVLVKDSILLGTKHGVLVNTLNAVTLRHNRISGTDGIFFEQLPNIYFINNNDIRGNEGYVINSSVNVGNQNLANNTLYEGNLGFLNNINLPINRNNSEITP